MENVKEQTRNWISIWGWRVIYAIHINLIVMGLLMSYAIYRVVWEGDQITYTNAHDLDYSESVPTPTSKRR